MRGRVGVVDWIPIGWSYAVCSSLSFLSHPTPSALFLASWLCHSTAIIKLGDAALLCCQRFMCLLNSWSLALPRGLRDFYFFPLPLSHLSGCATNHWPAFNLLYMFQPSQLGIRFWVGRPAMLNWVPSLFSRPFQWCNSYCFLLIYLFSACQSSIHLRRDTLRHTMACGS